MWWFLICLPWHLATCLFHVSFKKSLANTEPACITTNTAGLWMVVVIEAVKISICRHLEFKTSSCLRFQTYTLSYRWEKSKTEWNELRCIKLINGNHVWKNMKIPEESDNSGSKQTKVLMWFFNSHTHNVSQKGCPVFLLDLIV